MNVVTILLVGDELLAGHTRDANGHVLAVGLRDLGYTVRRIVVLPDVRDEICAELGRALDASDIVLVTGGLGPTHDDLTTSCVASFLGCGLKHDEEGWSEVSRRYARRLGVPIDELPAHVIENARRMVLIPEVADPLRNPVGAATPYAIHRNGKLLVVLPGVPAECAGIFEEEIANRLLPRADVKSVLAMEVSLPESAFADDLARVQKEYPDVAAGSYPRAGGVTVRFTGSAERAAEALQDFKRRLALRSG